MSILVKLVADYAMWFYGGLILIALFIIRAMSLSIGDRNRSIFALEKENASTRFTRAVINLIIVLAVAGGVYYTSTILIEEVPLPEVTPTPTVMVQLPPTPTPPPLLPTPTPTLTPTPRPTAAAQVAETPAAEASLGAPPNCPNPGAHITQPGDGATVSGIIQISGAATVANFDYYKIEFKSPGNDWQFIQDYKTPVGDGLLATWNTDTVPPGQYGFRLVVVDSTGNYPTPCEITLNVNR